jgi:hypothetical protein
VNAALTHRIKELTLKSDLACPEPVIPSTNPKISCIIITIKKDINISLFILFKLGIAKKSIGPITIINLDTREVNNSRL